ncbi:hypothetical protein FDECE_603 [Fusarium decemcellulare]|nr:hypothetical protein FDECE_603 [Fusarium decemcellulare]
MPRQFQFVAVSNPTGPVPSESRKLSHSHATREAHARERRLRVQRYQREVAQFRPKVDLSVFETLQPLIREPNSEWDPFSAIARPLSHQEYFLLDHYIRVVVPHSAMHCALFDYPGDHLGQIMQDWVGLAITDKDLLDAAILLSACRDIVRSKPDDLILTQMALHYKQRGLETLRHALGGVSSRVSVLTIARALALAFDEVRLGMI